MAKKVTLCDYDYLFKIMIIGDPGVGKSSLIKSFVNEPFKENYEQSRDYDFKIKSNMYIDEKNIKVQVWDTYTERFRQNKRPYRGSHGVLILYDITDRQSFYNVKMWHLEIQRYACENCKVLLVGTKSDIPEISACDRMVTYEEGLECADTYDIPFIECSAKQGYNVYSVFMAMVKEIYEYRLENEGPSLPPSNKVNLVSFKKAKNNNKKCILN
ncbi:hypothetical protein DICPUDRAFT_25125 [Dictyostelium purpureum]|uniref:Rab GTPase n=1 Tax=Dictyostelium purpureum TaxID=5786 RepID=F0Z6C3_DICPU|nr:uncharacterized protein DICPUDRAFT_25125 [Dictyostelium purpureum]EGC40415.1 hypothetical protein DICPUDRAFT_25125 [Dictyostelium purpureum]|eukprot:XP_003282962.1 hypothetical protein DICPUDRAFT_25125 [Dictyostelium purpureum]